MSDERGSLLPSWIRSGVIGHLDPFSENLYAKPSLLQYSRTSSCSGREGEGGLSSAVAGAIWFAHNLQGQS